jgi:MT0933-like antitoxin protein
MPDFGKLFGRAKQQAAKSPDKVRSGVDKAQEFADKHLDDKYNGHIEKAGDMAEKALGVDGNDGAQTPSPDAARRPDGSGQ